MDSGEHTKFPWLTFLPVKAFRLLPEQSSGHKTYLTIDGEKFDSQVMQAEVMPRKGRVFSRWDSCYYRDLFLGNRILRWCRPYTFYKSILDNGTFAQ